jgi:hypothetical protein
MIPQSEVDIMRKITKLLFQPNLAMLFQQKFLVLFKKTIYRGIYLKIKKKFIKNYFYRE